MRILENHVTYRLNVASEKKLDLKSPAESCRLTAVVTARDKATPLPPVVSGLG